MDISTSLTAGTLNVMLSGRFSFSDHLAFRETIRQFAQKEVSEVVFDLTRVEYIDSSALGMLLLARDEASKHKKTITIHGAHGQVKKTLEIALFSTLFIMN